MKRRNVDCGKLRRPLKRSKLTEGLYGSTFLYIKFLSFWALVLLADFLLEFRFEFLWPFWLLLRSVYDSFKYQGLAFSVFFVCVALTSDMICFLFIPIHWLFFAASTYVWVQYVWHTDRGVCLPTVCLWLLFIYIEASVRLKDLKHLPAHLDLCRPFAAHCIGYPVVTLGFGIKSYVGYRIRQRRQREVAKENEFYTQLLLEALPPEQQQLYLQQQQQQLPTSPEKTRGCSKEEENSSSSINANVSLTWNSSSSTPNSTSSSASSTAPSPTALVTAPRPASPVPVQGPVKLPAPSWSSKKASAGDKEKEQRSSSEKADKVAKLSNGAVKDIDFYDHKGSVNDYHEGNESDKTYKQQLNGSSHHTPVRASVSAKETTVMANGKEKKAKLNNQQSNVNSANNNNVKDEHCLRLECDIKRLKADLQSSRAVEQDLRAQVQQLTANERSVRSELAQSQQDNDNLQAKLHNLVSARQTDKQTIASLEKKLSEERKARTNAEALLASERRAKKTEVATPPQPVAPPRSECGEACKNRKRELEAEVKQLRRDVKLGEERARQVEQEAQSLRALQASTARSAANQANVASAETEMLLTALSNLQDKNVHLETSLSAETRLKLDLFSALGEARRQLELRETILLAREREIVELKSKVAEVLAVMPTTPAHIQSNGALDLRLDVGLRLSDLADLADFGLNSIPQLTDLDTGRPYTSKLLLPTSLGLTHAHLATSARNGNVMTPDHDLKGSNLDPNATAYTPKTLGNGDSN